MKKQPICLSAEPPEDRKWKKKEGDYSSYLGLKDVDFGEMPNACLTLRNDSWSTLKIHLTKRSAWVFVFRWAFLTHQQCQQRN